MYQNILLPVLFACTVAQTVWVQYDPFFWDTIQLASKHAHFFFNNHLQFEPLPADIDSGHPPLLGYYLALVWTVFGKSLPASHWAMLPFLLANVWMLYRIGIRIVGEHLGWFFPLIVLADPVVAGQSVLVSPDILVLTGMLSTVMGITEKRPLFIIGGAMLLCAASMRGMMTAAALGLWVFFREKELRKALAAWRFFIPGYALGAAFLFWHRVQTGWIGHHPDSPWAPAFQQVGMSGFGRNILIVGWRWLDFGRVAEWVVLAWIWWKYTAWKSLAPRLGATWTLWAAMLLLLSPSALLYQNLSAHRYFIPAFVAFHLLVCQVVAGLDLSEMRKKIWLALVVASLLGGNLWVYPRGISMDWDATLAHLPYHRLRADMLEYLDREKIDFAKVGTAFPNVNTGENVSLNGDLRNFSEIDYQTNEFILASNIFNDISGQDYEVLEEAWFLRKERSSRGVWIKLYERKQPQNSNLHH